MGDSSENKHDAEQVTVRRVKNSGSTGGDKAWAFQNLLQAFMPLLGGLALDLADLLTAGPVGIFAGALIGVPVGWFVTSMYNMTLKSRVIISLLCGLYCMMPGTFFIPLATIISSLAGFCRNDKSGH